MRKTAVSEDQSAPARQYLADLIYECLLEAGQALRATEIAHLVSEVAPVSPRVVAQTLEEHPDFVSVEWTWDLAYRRQIQDQPIGGAIRGSIAAYGKPLGLPALCAELGAGRGEPPAMFTVVVEQQAGSPDLVQVRPGLYALRDWLLHGADADEGTVRFISGLEHSEDLDAAVRAIGRKHVRRNAPAATAAAVLEVLGAPLRHKALAFIVWRHHRKAARDPALFTSLLASEDAVLLRGPRWCTPSVADALAEAVAGLSENEDRARGVPPAFDVSKLLSSKPRSRKRFSLSSEAVREAVAAVKEDGGVRVDDLVADLLGLYPGDASFAAAVRALAEKLDHREGVVPLGFGRYCSAELVPNAVRQAPAILAPVPAGESDGGALLSDRQLPPALRKLIHDPEKEDFGEEKEVRLKARRRKQTSTAHVVPYHHLQAGTLKIRRIDYDLFPSQPEIVRATFRYQQQDFNVWLNNALGLAYGLGDWYAQYVPGPGVVIRTCVTDAPGAYELQYDGETDPLAYIDEARLEVLKRLRAEAERAGLSVLDILHAVMDDHPRGMHFETVVAEVNVIRRTAKRLIASQLCSSSCFGPVSGQPAVWERRDSSATRGARARPSRRRRVSTPRRKRK